MQTTSARRCVVGKVFRLSVVRQWEKFHFAVRRLIFVDGDTRNPYRGRVAHLHSSINNRLLKLLSNCIRPITTACILIENKESDRVWLDCSIMLHRLPMFSEDFRGLFYWRERCSRRHMLLLGISIIAGHWSKRSIARAKRHSIGVN